MAVQEKLYLLADGTYADPKACKKGDDGVLRHENGVHVALMGSGEPVTLGDVPVESKNVDAAAMSVAPAPAPAPAPAEPHPAPPVARAEPKAG